MMKQGRGHNAKHNSASVFGWWQVCLLGYRAVCVKNLKNRPVKVGILHRDVAVWANSNRR